MFGTTSSFRLPYVLSQFEVNQLLRKNTRYMASSSKSASAINTATIPKFKITCRSQLPTQKLGRTPESTIPLLLIDGTDNFCQAKLIPSLP
jgi:hypothetical protein